MAIQLLLQMFIGTLNVLFGWLPQITRLPEIGGFDIDTALVGGVQLLYRFLDSMWPIKIMFQGFLFLMSFYLIKIIGGLILGSRLPGK
jgi:hypothetical protein